MAKYYRSPRGATMTSIVAVGKPSLGVEQGTRMLPEHWEPEETGRLRFASTPLEYQEVAPVAKLSYHTGSGLSPNFEQRTSDWDGQPKYATKRWGTDGEAPTTLFSEDYPAKLDYMFADRRMRGAVPGLLGVAVQEHRKAQGVGEFQNNYLETYPTHSDDLSDYSSRVVRGARGRGANIPAHPENPTARPTNDIDFDRSFEVNLEDYKTDEFWQPVSDHDLGIGKRIVRNVLGPSQHMASPQFSRGIPGQGKLF